MKTFSRRSDQEYQERLKACLALGGDIGLRATAEPLGESVKADWPDFERAISLDFVGCTSTTLFDPGGMIARHCHFGAIDELVKSVEQLNREGTMVRIRILLLYPYSAAGQIRIQAENSTRRSSIENPDFKRGVGFIEQLSDEMFFGSSLFSTLQRTLKAIYEWLGPLGPNHPQLEAPNRFSLRFSIFNPIICGLRVNTRFFFDVYSYAKHKSRQSVCSGDTQPVIEVTRGDELPYQSFCDHFRYLWRYDATLDAEDVVDISGDCPRLKAPDEIDFGSRTARLSSQSCVNLTHLEARQVSRKAWRILERHCPPVRPSSSVDVAFLGCAWRASGNAPAAPNADAHELYGLWRHNFVTGNIRTVPHIDINLVSGAAGKNLSGVLYDALREATIGIIILSAENAIAEDGEEFVCTPNVYHELGFLMAHVPRDRTFVFKENRVRVPSNVGGLIWINYDEGKICLGFLNLIEGLRDAGVFGVDDAAQLAEGHLKYLRQQVENKILSTDDLDWAKGFLRSNFDLSGSEADD